MATASCRLTSSSIVEQDVDRFTQYVYKDPETGCEMSYNLYLPKDYDPNKSYPLVFFVADASANINNTKTPLFQGNGATVWTEPEEQAKHPCIVLAPQYTQDLVQSIGMMTTDENVWTPGLTLLQSPSSMSRSVSSPPRARRSTTRSSLVATTCTPGRSPTASTPSATGSLPRRNKDCHRGAVFLLFYGNLFARNQSMKFVMMTGSCVG